MLSPTIHVSGTDAPWKRQNKLFISSKPPPGCLVSWNIVSLRSFVQIENLQINWCKSASTSDFVGKARCTSTSATTSINLTTNSDNIIKVGWQSWQEHWSASSCLIQVLSSKASSCSACLAILISPFNKLQQSFSLSCFHKYFYAPPVIIWVVIMCATFHRITKAFYLNFLFSSPENICVTRIFCRKHV